MKVSELINELSKYDGDMEVVTQHTDWMGTTYCKATDLFEIEMVRETTGYDYRPKYFGDKTFVEALLIS